MNQTNTTETKPRQSTFKVLNIRGAVEPKPLPGGAISYKITVTTPDYQQEDIAVTSDVYRWTIDTKPMYRVTSDWMLTKDEESGLIMHVTELERNPANNKFKETDDTAAKHLTITKYPDGSLLPTGKIPAHVREDTIQDVLKALTEHGDKPLRAGMHIGRYVVLERREKVGHDEIHIDPMARQV